MDKTPARPRSRPWLWAGIAIVIILAAAGVSYWRFRPVPQSFIGGVLSDKHVAADFGLTDQLGRAQTLSGFRGKVVALTFIYTNCPDVCPLIASNMHITYQQLGSQAKQVAMVAVTVDPEADNVEQIKRFSDSRRLTDEWFFLTGTRPQLEKVWASYGIYAQHVDIAGKPISPVAGHDQTQAGGSADPELLEHSAPVFLIDKRGYVRVLLPPNFQADDLITDFRLLLAEP